MRRRSTIVLCLMAMLSPLLRAEETATLRVTSSMGGTMQRGQSVPVTWTVTGTTDPVRLLLQNMSTAVGMLEGGEVQLVTTSGGSLNTVSRNVTALNPGEISIKVEIEPGRNASAEEIASTFHKELQRIASWLEKAANDLPVERTGLLQKKTVRLDDVLDLLDRTEAYVRLALPYPELMAFQDAVTYRLENYRRQLTGIAKTEIITSDDAIVLVRARSEARVREEQARSVLFTVVEWLRGLSGAPPMVNLCFRMSPSDGAGIVLHAASVPRDQHSAAFISPLDLYLGRWVYEVTRDTQRLTSDVFDLTSTTGRVLVCPTTAGHPCRLIEGPTENCR